MDKWLAAALDYVPQWLGFQMRALERPGCSVAVAHQGRIVFERAFGTADAGTGAKLTPRHRFRVASHSKSFTAAAVMKLRERRKLRLDDPIGQYVGGLHPETAAATIQQLLSHSAGVLRDGHDGGQWVDVRPFLDADEVLADLRKGPVIPVNTRFKYSNHGYALLGMAIEQITGESYASWMKREIVVAAGLKETLPDMPLPKSAKLASGHSGKLLLGRRVVIPGRNVTNALAPATGFISTAADLARFYAQLAPDAANSFLSAASRREMVRRHWRETPGSAMETYYGLGVGSGALNGWEWFGHGGGFQGFITRTAMFPAQNLAISVLTNSLDGLAGPWLDGIVHVMQAFQRHGAPTRSAARWGSRWWSKWGALDLLPMGNCVMVTQPGFFNPMMEASELELTGRDRAKIVKTSGSGSFGEPVRLIRNKAGKPMALQLAATRLLPEARMAAEMRAHYETAGRRRRR